MISRHYDDPTINEDWSHYAVIARREQSRAVHAAFVALGARIARVWRGIRRRWDGPGGRAAHPLNSGGFL